MKKLLINILQIPTYSHHEFFIKKHIIDYLFDKNIKYEEDDFGNLIITKGVLCNNEAYPCVVAHLDTVHKENEVFINNSDLLPLDINHNIITSKYGVGGDDKCGIAIALKLLDEIDKLKIIFFVREEIKDKKNVGSNLINPIFLNDVGYVIGFDSPEFNRAALTCKYIKLMNKSFFNTVFPICEKNGLTRFKAETSTDVMYLRRKINVPCMNIGSGYYKQHTLNEYVKIDDVIKSYSLGKELILHLGNKKYFFKHENIITYNSKILYFNTKLKIRRYVNKIKKKICI